MLLKGCVDHETENRPLSRSEYRYLYLYTEKEVRQERIIMTMVFTISFLIFPVFMHIGVIPNDMFVKIMTYCVLLPMVIVGSFIDTHIMTGKYQLSAEGIQVKYFFGSPLFFAWNQVEEISVALLRLDGKSGQVCLVLYLNDKFRFERKGDRRAEPCFYWRRRHDAIVIRASDEREEELLNYIPQTLKERISINLCKVWYD